MSRPLYDLLPAEHRGRILSLSAFECGVAERAVTQLAPPMELMRSDAGPAEIEAFERRLFGALSFAAAPAPEQAVATLALWLNCRSHHEASPAAISQACGRRVCELIGIVARDYPDFITAPGVWNMPSKKLSSSGTLVQALLFADVRIDSSWMRQDLFDQLVHEAGALMRLPGPGAETFSAVVAVQSRQLYTSAAWMSANRHFLSDFAALVADPNREWLPTLLPLACSEHRRRASGQLREDDIVGPRGARTLLSALANHHPSLLPCQLAGSDDAQAERPAQVIHQVAKEWLSAAAMTNSQALDIGQVARDAGALVGLSANESMSQLASCIGSLKYSGKDAVMLATRIQDRGLEQMPGLAPLLRDLVAAGLRPDSPTRYVNRGLKLSKPMARLGDALAARFGEEQVKPFATFSLEHEMQLAIRRAGEPGATARPQRRATARCL